MPGSATSTPQDGRIHLRGHIVDDGLRPIPNATVAVVATSLQQATGADGGFDFGLQERRIYTLHAAAPGFIAGNLTVTPEQETEALRFVLQQGLPVQPYNTTVHLRGIIQCALEVLIISPSCDSALVLVPGAPHVFTSNQTILFQADPGWRTLVLDVVFDGSSQPGLAGLRTVLRATFAPDSNGTYAQYGRWNETASYTVRVEPGQAYPDGVDDVPANATGFQVDVYPQSFGHHATCPEACFLGVGAGMNVKFDLYATLFYVDPAPAGFTLRSG